MERDEFRMTIHDSRFIHDMNDGGGHSCFVITPYTVCASVELATWLTTLTIANHSQSNSRISHFHNIIITILIL